MNLTGLQHLLDIGSLSPAQLKKLIDLSIKIATYPANFSGRLKGRVLINVFMEPSTRTRISFEMASKRLGMQVINFQPEASSTVKGEAFMDTIHTLMAMQPDALVLRHKQDGVMAPLVEAAASNLHLINAGDGCAEHPTQALLDALTLQRAGKNIAGMNVVIAGDILHSRVARSDIDMLKKLGAAQIRLAGPGALLPGDEVDGVRRFDHLDMALKGADAVIMLRIQRERFGALKLPDEASYFQTWGLSQERLKLAAPDCVVLHPGPVNRQVEIASDVVDGDQSLVREQVKNGVFARMAVLLELVGG